MAYWYQYKLPGIIARAQHNRKLELQQAYNNAVASAKQEELAHLARLKALVKQNPIEQAETEYLNRTERYNTFKAAMEKIGTKLKATRAKIDRKKNENPHFDFKQMEAELTKADSWYQDRLKRLAEAKKALGAFRDKLDEARFKWEIQLDMNDAIRSMNATDRDAKINEMLVEIAFDTVQQEFDAIFAKIEVDAAEVRASDQVKFGNLAIDTSDVQS